MLVLFMGDVMTNKEKELEDEIRQLKLMSDFVSNSEGYPKTGKHIFDFAFKHKQEVLI